MINFEMVGKGIMFIYDNFIDDKELSEYIDNIDQAEHDSEIKINVRKIIEILENRTPLDDRIETIKQLFKDFI